MAVHLGALLFLTGLTGILSIKTVSEVSVKTGGSVSIPCLYDSKYVNNVKYLCKGYYYSSCSYAVKTNQPSSSGKFFISDDKSQRIFTVTINDVTNTDEDYWCVVEIDGGQDDRRYFHMSVTSGTPSLYVDNQEVTGFEGEQITISCHSSNPGVMKWCKLGSSCVTTSEMIDGTTATINATVPNVFTVTLSGLKMESSGWYYCVKGDFQMPVHVTVTERPSTTAADTDSTTVEGEKQPSVSFDLKRYVIPLIVLIFTVMVAVFIWLVLRRRKQKQAESSAMRKAEEEITYSHVKLKRKPANEIQRSHVESDGDVLYSSVVTAGKQQRVEENDDVTYSNLA